MKSISLRLDFFLVLFGRQILADGVDFNRESRFGYAFHSLNFAELNMMARYFECGVLAEVLCLRFPAENANFKRKPSMRKN
jgi:hypothetical protein